MTGPPNHLDGEYRFLGLPIGPSGGPPICYVVRVDTTDPGVLACGSGMLFTPLEYPVPLDADAPTSSGNDFGVPVELMRFEIE